MILLTSAGPKGAPSREIAELFDAYLVKPARESMLLDSIATILQEKSIRKVKQISAQLSESVFSEETGGESSLHILVAEDNIVNQMVVTAMLKNLGCDCHVVGNGQEALDYIKQATPDIVLMDISMPEMDGIAATTELRKLGGAAAAIPVIGVTAHAMREDQERCIAAGMNDYLPKPIKQDALSKMLEKWGPSKNEIRIANA